MMANKQAEPIEDEVPAAPPDDTELDETDVDETDLDAAGSGEESADTGESTGSSAEEPRPHGGGGGRRWWRWIAPVLAVAVLASGLVAWYRTANDADLARAKTRDQVVIAATHAIETMNTMDHRKVDKGLRAWAEVTTGTLHDQLVSVGKKQRELLANQGKIATGTVTDLAVTELDGDTATVIAAVEVAVRDKPGDKPSVKRNRFTADLALVDGAWLIENLQQVAVQLR